MEEIGIWTAQNFSSKQAELYLDDLVARCDAVAAGHLQHFSCRQHFVADLRADVRFIRAGKHFVFFVETPSGLMILAFIHQSMDVAKRLKAIL